MHIGVITNPNSRKNRDRPHRAAELQAVLGGLGEVHATPSVEAIKPVAREFLRRRARFWVADGGDGALHWLVRAGLELLEEEEFRNAGVALPLTLPTNGGTIDFVAHHVGIRGDAPGLLRELRLALERGEAIEEVEVDSMRIQGVRVEGDREVPFRTYGFASAAGGVGQRFYSKYYADADPSPKTILKVVSKTVASMPVALSPLRRVPGLPESIKQYARDLFRPTEARVFLDGELLPGAAYTGIHIAAMSINLGGVFRFFGKADQPETLHALVGAVSPVTILRNLPRMHLGRELRGENVIDRACREMTIEAIGDEHLDPIIDGEYYRGVRRLTFSLGPRVRIPKVRARRLSQLGPAARRLAA
jgi:diacylglycerol kinase family enzyme